MTRTSRRLLAAAAALAIVALARPAGAATLSPSAARARFSEAGRALAEGRAEDAVRLYGELLRGGRRAPELYYNLGNASLLAGRPGAAVLSYLRAWRLAPRDQQIRANLRAAQQSTGAAEADRSEVAMLLTLLSEREWAGVGAASWWAACLLLGASLLLSPARRRARAARLGAAIAAAVALAAVLGLLGWRAFDRDPELVVVAAGVSALSEPRDAAPPSFPLPEGSVVRARSQRAAWLEVESGQLTGWVRRAACSPATAEPPPP